jgi:hypothetical protein
MGHLASRRVLQYYLDCVRLAVDELGLPGDAASERYLAGLLARYAFRIDVSPETVAGCLSEIQRCWRLDDPAFDPRREVSLRQDVGDATLFLTGFLWERTSSPRVRRSFIRMGRRAYRFLAEYHRASGRPEVAVVFGALSRRFPSHSVLLMYIRETHLGVGTEQPVTTGGPRPGPAPSGPGGRARRRRRG